ncbi:MAG TPA: lipoyl synthase [Acidimicrobiales bacterium]|nr:lipoyl synthase [Acidimicrobiales bacterium]
MTLRVRWLGRVPYREALDLQHALFASAASDHVLLLEHPPVYTLGVRAALEHVLTPPDRVGADLVRVDRGGDVTYHGPGQLVGYPILTLPGKRGMATGMADTVAYVNGVEQLLIDALRELGVTAGRLRRYPGVWVDVGSDSPRKIAAIGVRLSRGRTMHGFALNVSTDLSMFEHIVPCGIAELGVTSLLAEGVDVEMSAVVDVVARLAVERWGANGSERQDVAWRERPEDLSPFSRGHGAGEPVRLTGRLAQAGVTEGLQISARKPEWLRARVRHDRSVLALRHTMRDLGLTTVCEEAGCPNLSECWADGTATFMINGASCTRACGFCLVDTSRPEPLDVDEPARVAEAVRRMGVAHAVVTAVARDDLADGGAQGFVATIGAIRRGRPGVAVEVLIPDCKGEHDALDAIFAARPDVLNHNIETVPRLQRAVRPSAGYARSLGVLARAKQAGLVTKSGLIVGMGETDTEVAGTLADLRGVGVDIVTIGQYLRPTSHHLPVARWVPPESFDEYRRVGEALGIAHVEASPLTRSSYHARSAAAAAHPVAPERRTVSA